MSDQFNIHNPDILRGLEQIGQMGRLTPETFVTSGKVWRSIREQGKLLKLPSGNTCRVRNVPFDLFIKFGRIPNSLLSVAVKGLNEGQMTMPDATTLEEALENIEFVNAIVRYAVVEPEIVDENPTDAQILIDDIELEDKFTIAGLLGLPARDLERFCQAQNELMANLGADKGDEGPSIFDTKPERVESESDGSARG